MGKTFEETNVFFSIQGDFMPKLPTTLTWESFIVRVEPYRKVREDVKSCRL